MNIVTRQLRKPRSLRPLITTSHRRRDADIYFINASLAAHPRNSSEFQRLMTDLQSDR